MLIHIMQFAPLHKMLQKFVYIKAFSYVVVRLALEKAIHLQAKTGL